MGGKSCLTRSRRWVACHACSVLHTERDRPAPPRWGRLRLTRDRPGCRRPPKPAAIRSQRGSPVLTFVKFEGAAGCSQLLSSERSMILEGAVGHRTLSRFTCTKLCCCRTSNKRLLASSRHCQLQPALHTRPVDQRGNGSITAKGIIGQHRALAGTCRTRRGRV